ARPPLLLLDEPLSNLDAKLREKMRFELKRLQRELAITSVYVTHDQSEALALSHRIAVMNEGRIVQVGPPREIYERPRARFVAEFVGTANFLSGEATGTVEKGLCELRVPQGALWFACAAPPGRGEKVEVSVRPEHVEVSKQPLAGPNVWEAVVETQVFLGFHQDLELRWGAGTLIARVHPSVDVNVGEHVHV